MEIEYRNSRYKKAEEAIRTAFFKLMQEKGFSNLSVTDIVGRAKINRSTFYVYYEDKYDLLRKVEDDILNGLRKLVDQKIEEPEKIQMLKEFEPSSMLPQIKKIIHFLYENGRYISVLLGENGDPEFGGHFRENIWQIWKAHQLLKRLSIRSDYAVAALTGTVYGIILEWAEKGFQETEDEFAEILLQIFKGTSKFLFG